MSARVTVTVEDLEQLRGQAESEGLYRSDTERDACGVGFVAQSAGRRSHEVLSMALTMLERLEHRGGSGGADPLEGDGAGVLLQIPHALLAEECELLGIALPPAGEYGLGMFFMPRDAALRRGCEEVSRRVADEEGFRLLGVREVPTDPSQCAASARDTMPAVRQFFFAPRRKLEPDALERRLYVLRRRIERAVQQLMSDARETFYACTLSSRTVCYKGLLLPGRLAAFYADLSDERAHTAIAVVHQRFSTNTFPSWQRAHPYRMVAHNGEINALRGNVNWMRAREKTLASALLGNDVAKLLPVIDAGGSDSAMFDNALELLVRAGRALPHAAAMMIPEAWEKDPTMPAERRAFYEYHASLMEPWDGPAAMVFTDGVRVGATLDRNGLRPGRWAVTDDGLVTLASEAGVLDLLPERVVSRGRLQPGRMLLVDTEQGRVVPDEEIKSDLAARQPYARWLGENLIRLDEEPDGEQGALAPALEGEALRALQRASGYTREDLRMLLGPMGARGEEPVGSMGNDTPLAVLSDQPQLLFNYFKQLFAQVTNPPIDPIREELVMSLRTTVGAEGNLLDETPAHCRQIALSHPVVSPGELAQLLRAAESLRPRTVRALFRAVDGEAGLEAAVRKLCADALAAVRAGHQVVVLSDRGQSETQCAVPSLLAVSAVHHHLTREGVRTRCGLVVECADAREVMHFALLLGYGATVVQPYLACDSVAELARESAERGEAHADAGEAVEHYLHAANKGVLKVMSKMGISTLQSYRGAQIFEAIGLSRALVDTHFPGTPSRIDGVGVALLARESLMRHAAGFPAVPRDAEPGADLPAGGQYQWRRDGEHHQYNPDAVALLQHAVRSADYKLFKRYSAGVNDATRKLCSLRGLLDFVPAAPVPLSEVEPAREIVKRFKTGAMSYGSLSREAHETLAVAMNRIGARSNSGEGGEDPSRFVPDVTTGDLRRSAIKQVASGRFGVTSHYLVNADELQIKMAQGAKPGEGGQLPGHKVDDTIAKVRMSTPGVGLISPPPHHDIYSIEDLAQLIFDLKNANDRARVSVKLVAEVGVGTVAAGVAKAGADVILVSGDSGGTGAAPLTSIKHAGVPWELGLAEAQQVLMLNGLRGRVRLETDGQLKTGRDVAVAALLGAEEFGFATAALVSMGCVMMRVCHLNTCPVGVATQDPVLRARFPGQPEHVINFMVFVAEELREIMASLGFRTVDEMVGRVDRLRAADLSWHWKARGLDLSTLLHRAGRADQPARCVDPGPRALPRGLDDELIEQAQPALMAKHPVTIELPVRNTDRTACTRLSAEISRRFGAAGLPPSTVRVRLRGTAGQSFCAFLAEGVDVSLEGQANDYLGKGLSGGRVAVYPFAGGAEEQVVVGNVALYGATGGEVFVRGRAGERFAVRNSGATAVVEGVGDHGCEYMTRGTVVVLGSVGRNFAAGMSGGIAYVLDGDGALEARTNRATVALEKPDERDLATVRALIHRHYECTGSATAWRVLSGWKDVAPRIVRVMPVEYRRVLAARERESARTGSI